MHQLIDPFASLLGSAKPMYPSPPTTAPTTASVSDSRNLASVGTSTSSSESHILLRQMPSYSAVAPPPSPITSRLLSAASTRSTQNRDVFRRSHSLEGPDADFSLSADESLSKIFFPPPGDEILAGRQPGKVQPSSAPDERIVSSPQDASATVGGWSRDSTCSRSTTPGGQTGRATVTSARSARRRLSARRTSRAAAAFASPSSPHSWSQSTRGTDGQWTRLQTVSSPLSSPASSDCASPATRSPSPCASNTAYVYNRPNPYPELNFFRRNRMLRQIKQFRVPFKCATLEENLFETTVPTVVEELFDTDKTEKEGTEKTKEGYKTETDVDSEKKSDKSSSLPSAKKKRRGRKKSVKVDVSADEQTVRDEISYLRNQYLPKVLAEVEVRAAPEGRRSAERRRNRRMASRTRATGSKRNSSATRDSQLPAARPRDALFLRAGLLPPHLSPWRRALQTQLRAREAALRKPRSGSRPNQSSDSSRSPHSRPGSSKIFSPIDIPLTPHDVPTFETILKPPRTASFMTNYSVDNDEQLLPHSQQSSRSENTSAVNKVGGVVFYPVVSQVETALVNILRKKGSESVLETRRLPKPLHAPEEKRRWMSLLTTASVQRRVAEEQRRRRRGEGAHVMWAWRARQQPRPLVGNIFDRKPFFGAPGPNCNPLPWQN